MGRLAQVVLTLFLCSLGGTETYQVLLLITYLFLLFRSIWRRHPGTDPVYP